MIDPLTNSEAWKKKDIELGFSKYEMHLLIERMTLQLRQMKCQRDLLLHALPCPQCDQLKLEGCGTGIRCSQCGFTIHGPKVRV